LTDFIRVSSNPAPADGEVFEFSAADGARLRGAFFPVQNARGHAVVVTGWTEIIEKYFETAEDLRRRRLSVAMLDWRGQGLSDLKNPHASQWKSYFDVLQRDLRHFADIHVKARFSGPAVLVAHSMGALPALMLLASGYDYFSRAVLSAPMTQLFKGRVNTLVAAFAGAACALGAANVVAPRSKGNSRHFAGNIHTSDKTRYDRFCALKRAEPHIATPAPTFGWLRAALAASKEIHAPGYFSHLKTPCLIVSAGQEMQINGEDHERIAAASALLERKVIPGALHEIMMERDEIRAQFWRAFDDFIAPLF
jgi:lysophospholipase